MGKGLGAAAMIMVFIAGCVAGPVSPPPGSSVHEGVRDPSGDAPAFLDLVSGRFMETGDTVTVEIEIAEFDEASIADTLWSAGGGSAWIFLCWRQGDVAPPEWVRAAASVDKVVAPDTECAGVEMFVDEEPVLIGQYISYHGPNDGCNAFWFCAWRLPYTIVSGSPAILRIPIPRELMHNATVGQVLAKPVLESGIWPSNPDDTGDKLGRHWRGGACLGTTCAYRGTSTGQGSTNRILDKSDYGPDFVLNYPTESSMARPIEDVLIRDSKILPQPGGAIIPYAPDADVLRVDLEETTSQVAWLIRVASLDEKPSNSASLYFSIGGTVYAGDWEVVAGQVTNVAASSCDARCKERSLTPHLSFHPGTPGTIRFAFDWSEMNRPVAGDLVEYAEMFIVPGRMFRSVYQPSPAGDVYAYGVASGQGDPVFPGEPYWLRLGSPNQKAGPGA